MMASVVKSSFWVEKIDPTYSETLLIEWFSEFWLNNFPPSSSHMSDEMVPKLSTVHHGCKVNGYKVIQIIRSTLGWSKFDNGYSGKQFTGYILLPLFLHAVAVKVKGNLSSLLSQYPRGNVRCPMRCDHRVVEQDRGRKCTAIWSVLFTTHLRAKVFQGEILHIFVEQAVADRKMLWEWKMTQQK